MSSFSHTETPDLCRLPAEVGPCRGSVPKYYFDQELGRCHKFIYGGCKGNANNFDDEDSCIESCGGSKSEEKVEDVCQEKVTSGPCFGYVPRFFYNSSENKCQEFIYGGCLGNGNNFNSKAQCEQACVH